jgi:hypothetical protein
MHLLARRFDEFLARHAIGQPRGLPLSVSRRFYLFNSLSGSSCVFATRPRSFCTARDVVALVNFVHCTP